MARGGRKWACMAQQSSPATNAILRRWLVEAETGYSRSTLYLRITQGLFTKPVKLGARSVGWPAAEVRALNAARIAGEPDVCIRELVAGLEQARSRQGYEKA